MRFLLASILLAVASAAPAEPLAPRQSSSAIVDLSVNTGNPKHLASGFIYGIPDQPNQVQDHWYTDIAFQYGRAGGAQLGAPNRGWIYGLNEYKGRLSSTLSNYNTCRKYGASFILLPHDIWGTDHANSSTVWPGDNGNWADYEKFLAQLMADLKANNALAGLVWDIWNEPDISIFWERSQQQWVELYVRTHRILRADSAFNSVQISGPTLAEQPTSGSTWWTSWLSAISSNNTIPDQYAYHLEGNPSDPNDDLQTTNASLASLLNTYHLPQRLVNINEYATQPEQIPSGAAWWISRLERYNAYGLRGNWLSGTELHDLFANLLSKPNPADYTANNYFAVGEYQVYKYYARNMTGHRTKTAGTTDRLLDVYATVGSDKVRILCGARHTTGTWAITVENLSAIGLPQSGSLSIDTYAFKGPNSGTEEDAPVFLNTVSHSYSGNSVNFPIYQTDSTTAYAFEFAV